MATNFMEIYSRAMTNLESPILSRLQANSLYTFCVTMNNYLQDALARYNPNKDIASRVAIAVPSQVGLQNFVGDGVTESFELTAAPKATENSVFKVFVGDNLVRDFTFDSNTNMLTFNITPQENAEIQVSWYNDGEFVSGITNEDITILAVGICLAWAYQTSNNLLDIDRSVSDTGDFKQHAPGSTQDAKVNWVKHYEEMFDRLVTRADWRGYIRKK